jgi:hypothetical protein
MVGTGARGSNAGDDFHYLWASRRVLRLLDSGSDLSVVRLEGLPAVDDPDDSFEAIDVSEYFGGETFDAATSVVVSQLKYSTTHPDLAWTSTRLLRQRRNRRSVLRDLVGVFVELAQRYPRPEVLSKLRIALVSNQRAAPSLLAALNAAQTVLASTPEPAGTAEVLRHIDRASVALLRELQDRLNLRSADFADFLRVLDLSGCGTADRFALERDLHHAMAAHIPVETADAARAVYDMVRREALPERRHSDGIRQADILAHLGVLDVADLFPAPGRFSLPDEPLLTPDAATLAAAVMAMPGGPVIAHGDAGIGKTTSVHLLDRHLPAGSVIVVYDCFGAGEYLSTCEERHTPRRFATQIVNELALKCGTALLVRPPTTPEDLWRHLARVIEKAAAAVAGTGGRLVLVVDAADNAAFAAADRGDRGFVDALWRLKLPNDATLVVTARTHRLDLLSAPEHLTSIQLRGFDPATSAAYVRRQYPDADHAACAAFHDRTDGNPRMQFYVLARAGKERWELPTLIEQSERTPGELFDDLVGAALGYVPGGADPRASLALLMALARPVRLSVLAAALDLPKRTAGAFTRALTPGVLLEGPTVAFRDEDFEAYVRRQLSDDDLRAAHGRLADRFLPRRGDDADAAAAVVDHLFHAERYRELVHLVVAEPEPTAVPDGFRRIEVRQSRLRRGLQAAKTLGAADEALRLTVLAAATAGAGTALSSVVRSYPDLAARHADPSTVTRLYLTGDHLWLGAAFLRTAAMYARDPGTAAEAEAQLAQAEAWIRRRATLADEDRADWEITDVDLARGAEAVYRLRGPAEALAWLARWRPPSVVLSAAWHLASALALDVPAAIMRAQLADLNVPLALQAPFVTAVWLVGDTPAFDWVDAVAGAVAARPRRAAGASWFVDLCELLAAQGHDPGRTLGLLTGCAPVLPTSRPWVGAFLEDCVPAIRARALAAVLSGRALSADDLVPQSLQPPAEGYDVREGDRGRFLEVLSPLVAVCTARAEALLADASASDLRALIEDEVSKRLGASTHRWFRADRTFGPWAVLAADAALRSTNEPARLVSLLADAAPAVLRNGTPGLLIRLGDLVLRRRIIATLGKHLCERAATYAETQPFPGSERWQLIAEAAAAADRFAPDVGGELFRRALDAAAGLDDAAAGVLNVHTVLAQRAATAVDRVRARELATGMAAVTEMIERHVADRRVIPYRATLAAMTALHPPTGFASAARWDDEDRVSLGSSIAPVVGSAVAVGFVSAVDGIDLLAISFDNNDRLTTILDLLSRLHATGPTARPELASAFSATVAWLRQHVPAHEQAALASRMLEWSTASGLPALPGSADLAALIEFARSLPVAAEPTGWPEQRRTTADTGLHELLSSAPQRPWASLADDVRRLQETYIPSADISAFIVEVARAADPSDRSAVLDAVAALAGDSLVHPGTVLRALRELIAGWHAWRPLASWVEAFFPAFVETYLPDLSWQWQVPGDLAVVGEVAGSPVATAQILAVATAAQLDELSAQQLHTVAATIGTRIDPHEAADVLAWSLKRLNPGPPEPQPARPPETTSETIAGLLWSIFGHPAKELRWRAAHGARHLLDRPNPQLLNALIACLNATSAGAFRSTELDFYWMSARSWLLLTFERVADIHPDCLAPHVERLAAVATDQRFPHAQVRELARRTALRVLAARPGIAPATREALQLVNRPLVGAVERDRHHRSDGRRLEGDWRFRLDPMDTLPYWYAPLAHVFGAEVEDVARRAERWIVDEWGRSDDDWLWDRRELRDEGSYEQMSNGHGRVPPVEGLRVYLEYHAMFLAAGELVDAGVEEHAAPYDDAGDPWESWLAGHLNASPDWWLADLAGPIPLEERFFGDPGHGAWQETSVADFDAALGLARGALRDRLVVDSWVDVRRQGGYGHDYVKAALVEPETAVSLLRALQTAANPRSFRLPNEHDWDGIEIDTGKFRLAGWLVERRIYHDFLDSFDPFAQGIRYSFSIPGERFTALMAAQADPTGMALRTSDGTLVAWVELWAGEPVGHDRYSSETGSDGHRTLVNASALLNFCRSTGMDLIVEVQLDRQLERRSQDPEALQPSRSRIYLIRRDGSVETVDGRHPPR